MQPPQIAVLLAAFPPLQVAFRLVARPSQQSPTVCTDTPSPWMIENGKDCGALQLENWCRHKPNWVKKKYCQQSCWDNYHGYDGDHCGAAPAQQRPVGCSDTPSPHMVSTNKQCATWSWGLANNCRSDSVWAAKKYCQKSCWDNNHSYDGDDCGAEPKFIYVAQNRVCSFQSGNRLLIEQSVSEDKCFQRCEATDESVQFAYNDRDKLCACCKTDLLDQASSGYVAYAMPIKQGATGVHNTPDESNDDEKEQEVPDKNAEDDSELRLSRQMIYKKNIPIGLWIAMVAGVILILVVPVMCMLLSTTEASSGSMRGMLSTALNPSTAST